MSLAYKKFMELSKEEQKGYDFREEVKRLDFGMSKSGKAMDPIEKFFDYKCADLRGDSKIDADSCQLILDLLYSLVPSEQTADKSGKRIALTGDVMNSPFKTLWYCAKESEGGKKLIKNPSKLKLLKFFEENGGKPFEKAEGFLKVAYTIGNFILVPARCNSPRGLGKTNDYWDLALYCIHEWYHDNSQPLKELLRGNEELVDEYAGWLESFGDWDNFVEATYMQPFVYLSETKDTYHLNTPEGEFEKKPHYGPPKPFWKDHFDSKYLPTTKKQIFAFFENASTAIEARSRLIVEALQKSKKSDSEI